MTVKVIFVDIVGKLSPLDSSKAMITSGNSTIERINDVNYEIVNRYKYNHIPVDIFNISEYVEIENMIEDGIISKDIVELYKVSDLIKLRTFPVSNVIIFDENGNAVLPSKIDHINGILEISNPTGNIYRIIVDRIGVKVEL